MRVKKSGGKVYGVELTRAEQRAIDMEVRRQLSEYTRKHILEIEAIVIWFVRHFLRWGEIRLKRFYDGLDDALYKLIDRYEMDTEDAPWLCTRDLKSEGIDIEKWHQQRHPNEKYEVGG